MADSDARDTVPPPPPEARASGPLAATLAGDAAAQRDQAKMLAIRSHPFRVTVFFEEPTYALWRAEPVREERTTFAFLAVDESDAIELATAPFREDA